VNREEEVVRAEGAEAAEKKREELFSSSLRPLHRKGILSCFSDKKFNAESAETAEVF
jgi:hypothetical protein